MATITASPFRLALCQLGSLTSNKTQNLTIASSAVKEAVQKGKANLVVLPEIFNSPYAVNSFRKYAEVIPGRDKCPVDDSGLEGSESLVALSKMAKENNVWLIGGSIPEIDPSTSKIYNTSPIFSPSGTLITKHRKVHLFDIDLSDTGGQVFKESETLSAGEELTMVEMEGIGKIGIGICYDVRFPEMAMIAARKGCVAMIYPSAFNTTTGPAYWELLHKARAVDNQFFVAMCSPARNMEASYHAYGHSMVVSPQGKVLVEADENPTIVYADIDPTLLAQTRKGLPVTVQRRFDVYADVAKGH